MDATVALSRLYDLTTSLRCFRGSEDSMFIHSSPKGLRRSIQISSSTFLLLSVSSQTVKWLMRNWSAGLVTSSQ